MKIAISTAGTGLQDHMESRFGRTPRFLIIDTATQLIELVDNTQNLNAAQGAGIQAAQIVVAHGASAVITGHTGPKAFKVLQAAGVKVYNVSPGPIEGLIAACLNGELTLATAADTEGHW